MKLLILITALLQTSTVQANDKGLGDMTAEMWRILLRKPLSFIGVQKAVKTANNLSESFCDVVDEPRHTRDEVDAVRHFILASVLSILVDKEFTREFLTAHEQRTDTYNDENIMDLKNNDLGIAFSDQLKNISRKNRIDFLKTELDRRLTSGNLFVLTTGRSQCANPNVFPNM